MSNFKFIEQINWIVVRRLKSIKFDTRIKRFVTANEFGKLCRAGTAVARQMSSVSSTVHSSVTASELGKLYRAQQCHGK